MKFQPKSGGAEAVKCELAAECLRASELLRLGVRGWSMVPTIWPDDVLMIEKITPAGVSQGDLVLFGDEGRFFVHRVVNANRFACAIQTRGDAMPRPDSPMDTDDLLGRVTFIVRGGRMLEPNANPGWASRAFAFLFQRSAVAARVIARAHSIYKNRRISSSDRAIPCQS